MTSAIDQYWRIKLETVKANLTKNRFEAHIAADGAAARTLVLDRLLPRLKPQSISWGGSLTFTESGLYADLKNMADIAPIDTFDQSIAPEAVHARRRQALLSDLYFCGTNAVTTDGTLVNLDMIGNRVAAITFGPRQVVILAGRNKIVDDLDQARRRIKSFAAPANVMRLSKKTPCSQTAGCHDCQSPDRICNTWTITEKSFPAGRIIVILINADFGL